MKLSVLRHHMKKILKAERFEHTLGVEKMAVRLARAAGMDESRVKAARLAALLHDAGKSLAVERQVDYCEKQGIPLSDDDLESRGVIHSLVSESLCRLEWSITDEAVLSAVRWHTTGKAGMSLLDKVVFAADYLDPGRGLKGARRLRKTALADLDAGVLEVIREKMCWIISKGEHLHPDTLHFYNSQAALLRARKI